LPKSNNKKLNNIRENEKVPPRKKAKRCHRSQEQQQSTSSIAVYRSGMRNKRVHWV
jgi:hypothetical protein